MILAYGRDPNFPGWPDTLQLNYANPELQMARIDELTAIAGKCDGVRCDMAMLEQPDGPMVPLACALAPETVGLIDDRRLALMKPGALLINVARARIVDEDALYAALKDGHLGGATLDVWWQYPTRRFWRRITDAIVQLATKIPQEPVH
jgi:lactate dehydrogenase-like 2-hydroxyacid dehydrogenase